MVQLIENIISRLKRIDRLVRLRATGTPRELAFRLGISASTLYEYLDTMKRVFGAPIRYSNSRRSYVYDLDGKLELKFKKDSQLNGTNNHTPI
ncbi:hypothetical protein QQ020_35425 [Fulvivirgaceae bacterium BMA12]|uniref:Helix-turn-helix type 11 domain-containing protein n=1 Tax=Agaribacillus aureus TaxID=3051825 RepID=A0ABT8LHY7_9BACT|nr:hypothetical protein [Fulvivirgaceae bacterium BMA12]